MVALLCLLMLVLTMYLSAAGLLLRRTGFLIHLAALLVLPACSSAAALDAAITEFVESHPRPATVIGGATVSSSMYDLKLRWYASNDEFKDGTGGALTVIGDLLITVGPKGRVSWFDLSKMQGPYATPAVAPMNLSGLIASGMVETSGMDIGWFRAAGAYAELRHGKLQLFVTHHVYEGGCIFFQLSVIDFEFDPQSGLKQASDWRSLFRPEPCIHTGEASANPFAGNQAGGKIVSLDDDELLVSFGDHEIDGYGKTANAPQDPKSPYGKIWKIAKDGSRHELFSTGMRNPQGLLIDRQGNIWESEHGPQGGDELNLIREGGNYGWPFQTYGVYYGGNLWPLNERQGDHSDKRFYPPAFSWIPSIAPTNLIEVVSDQFALWQGDLLLTTLKDKSLRRLRHVDGRIIYDERIEIGERLRDIVQLKDGRFAILNDTNKAIGIIETYGPNIGFLPVAVSENTGGEHGASGVDSPGEQVFAAHCVSCHHPTKIAAGPPLAGVINREIGSYPGYTYSPGLANAGRTWTRDLLLSFIGDPLALFPDTKMSAIRLTGSEADALYQYLASLVADATPPATTDGAEELADRDIFTLPFAYGQLVRVRPYEELQPGFWLGFDQAKGSSIYAQQERAALQVAGTPTRYVMKVDIRNLAGSEWMTVERPLNTRGDLELKVVLSARMPRPDKVRVELYVPQRNAPGKETVLGEAVIGQDFRTFEFTKTIKSGDFGDFSPGEPARIAVFLPLEDKLSIDLAQFDVSIKTN